MRIRLDYFDQNTDFEVLLPRDGEIEQVVSSTTDTDWALFHLDFPIEYDGRSYDYLLLRSRWQGHEIGEKEATSVFVLLVEDVHKATDGLNVDDFDHVVWGMTHRLGE